jgi:hypothetical protein
MGRPANWRHAKSKASRAPIKPNRATLLRGQTFGAAGPVRSLRAGTLAPSIRTCAGCGCTGHDCAGCIKRTGRPCHWVAPSLCSACDDSKVAA